MPVTITVCLYVAVYEVFVSSYMLRNSQTRTWMKQVREVAYDAEDCIDTFWHHNGHQYWDTNLIAGWLRKIIRPLKTLRAMHSLGMEIRDLKARALKVSERRLRYKVEVSGGDAIDAHASHASPDYTDLNCRLPAIEIDRSQLEGMGKKTKELINLLNDGEASLKVVAIVGFGGLGKTTLALTVYKSPEVKQIPARAFVQVSQNYDPRILLESLLKQLIQAPMRDPSSSREETIEDPLKGIERWRLSELISMCTTYLKDKRYFIVLDDLWSAEAWARMKLALPDNDKNSVILITTRNRHVTESSHSDNRHMVYEMKHLPEKESKKLFFNRVFQSDAIPEEYSGLKEISEVILKKCGGLPLAIVSIGGVLARMENKTKAEWEKVCDRLGYGLETSASIGGMRRILSLSYHDLPYNLKACFLYLSVFPEDYEIRRGPLVRQWAAEGFIRRTHESNPEEVAERYLDEFVSRSIVTPTRVASTGVVRCCKVHDIMLEVITSKSIQENFFSFMGHQQYSATGHDKIRRLSIHTHGNVSDMEQEDPNINFSHARSLSILRCSTKPRLISFSHIKLLRVLDLEGCLWLSNEDLKEICKLYLLKYLCLRRTNVSQLPKLVGRLKELLTLDVRETSIRELPETITELGRLKHLLGGKYIHYTRISRVKGFEPYRALIVPHGLKNMKSLQKIAHVDIAASLGGLQELSELSQVTKLCVINHESGGDKWKHFAESLNKMHNSIRNLSIIHWLNGDMGLQILWELSSPPVFLQKLYLWGKLMALPPWISKLSYLVDLSLRENFLDGDFLIQLGELQSLMSLKLYHESFITTELCFKNKMFPRLKELIVDNAPNLDELRFEGGAPNLERLTLAFERKPERGIFGIKTLLRLKEVEFFGEIIIDSLVDEVEATAATHPKKPRVYREFRTVEDPKASS